MQTAKMTIQPGPVVQTKLALEGADDLALVDSGSPMTIVSHTFLLQALAAARPPDQSCEDWEMSMCNQLRPQP